LTALLRFLASSKKVSLGKGKESNLMKERGKLQQLATASCGGMIPTRFIRQTVITVKIKIKKKQGPHFHRKIHCTRPTYENKWTRSRV